MLHEIAMILCYVLPSPTWGMHQYTADLAGRMAQAGHQVHVVTTRRAPLERYGPGVTLHTPIGTRSSGFGPDALRPRDYARLGRAVVQLAPDLVHITGPHLWNPGLLRSLRRAGVPTVHTLHDLHPHRGAVYGRLLYLWNRQVRDAADGLLVHGERYRQELLGQGAPPSRVACTPLTHLFLSQQQEAALRRSPPEVTCEPWALFLGRLEAYKGLDVLVEAARRMGQGRVVIAGPGSLQRQIESSVPANVEVRDHLIADEEAIDLFRRCGLVVLPYREASQSALVAAAYFFQKPVVVSRVGALPEYVREGQTGWVAPPGDAQALAHALGLALGDPQRLGRMGAAGRAWYEEQRAAEEKVLTEFYGRLARQSGLPQE